MGLYDDVPDAGAAPTPTPQVSKGLYDDLPDAAGRAPTPLYSDVPEAAPNASHGGYPTADGKPDPLAMPNILSAAVQGVVRGAQEVQSTVSGERIATPESPAAAPLSMESLTSPISVGAPQVAYRLGKGAPIIGGGIAGGVAGAIAAPESGPIGPMVGGSLGAAGATLLQSLGPSFQEEAQKTPEDLEGAWTRAKAKTAIGAAASGISWAAFGVGANLIDGPIKNLLFQSLIAQPGISAGGKVGENLATGRPASEGAGQAAIEGGVMTAIPAAGHAVVTYGAGKIRGTEPPPPTPEDVANAFGTLTNYKQPPKGESEPPVTVTEVPPPEPGSGGASVLYPPAQVTPNTTVTPTAVTTVDANASNPTTDIPDNVVNFLAAKKAKLEPPTSTLEARASADEPPSDPNAPISEEITAKPGANTARLAKLLGPKLYGEPTDMAAVTIKELFQNGFDAIKSKLEKGEMTQGNLTVNMDRGKRTITVHDDGSGMTPDVLAKQFLEIGGTSKESNRASGGLGIAKMLFLFANKNIKVLSMRDGRVARLASSGDQLFAAMENPEHSPKIQVSEPTAQERKLFPKGHGTVVEVTVPHSFQDSGTGEKRFIDFEDYSTGHKVLEKSPLFDNINVKFNGEALPLGASFPYNDFSHFANAKFDWGTARIYASKVAQPVSSWDSNLHILSNGLWQFSKDLKMDPSSGFGENVPRQFYVDINSKVKPEDAGYPFDLNRQRFAKTAESDLGKIFNYMSLLYRFESLSSDATNFGEMYYLDDTGEGTGAVSKSKTVKIAPERKDKGLSDLIHPGDDVSVVDGQLRVNGRQIPELDIRKIKSMIPDQDQLKVPQSEIRPDVPMVHDNTVVVVSELEKKSIVGLAEEKFGARFHRFMYGLGDAFREVRDVVAEVLNYPDLKEEGVGLSFDTEYRGVSIRVPFSASFVNPAIPEYTDPLRAAVGVVGTMIHELAHHQVRNHDAGFPAEMQRILINLDTHSEFDFHAFKQKVVSLYAENQDIFQYLNGFYSGAFTIEARGKRLQDTGSNEARTGGPIGAVAPSGGAAAGRPAVRPEFETRSPSAEQQPGRSGSGATAPAGGNVVHIQEHVARSKLTDFNRNARALREDDAQASIPFPQDENTPLREGMEKLYQAVKTKKSSGGTAAPPPHVQKTIAHADRIVKGTKYWFGLDRLVDRLPHLQPLVNYWQTTRQMINETAKIHDAATRIAKEWRHLGDKAEPLAALIDDVANMNYRNSQEVAVGVARHPSQQEFGDLVRKHKVSADALKVFNSQKKFFEDFLQIITQNARETATRTITDPVKLADQLDVINQRMRNLLGRPYFPFLRFGAHAVVVKDKAGHTVWMETFERRGLIPAEKRQMAAKARLQQIVPADHTVENFVLPETAVPFIGLPPELLEGIQRELQLTVDQKNAMEQIRYDLSPAASFAHRFQNKNYTAGYSHDFLRAFSRYAFHGARYHARTKFAWALRKNITELEAMKGNQAGTVGNYLTDHLTNTILDTKGDYGMLKGAIFLWTFGFSAAGAAINLSQMPMISYPFLAAKFGGVLVGDARATKSMVKAMVDLKNFYKKGSYDKATSFEMKALDYAIKSGRISEAMAAELAGLAQGESLFSMGNNKFSRGFQTFMQKAGFLFEMAEQMNRRVTFRAALDLAVAHPNSVGVKEALNKYSDEYNNLVARGDLNQTQAAAIIAASYAVEQTQFVYSRETRPRFMRGKLIGAILVFKTYMINVLQLLGANKSSVMPRFMIMMALMAGLMGLPGAEDLLDIIKLVGKHLFGKDWRPEQQLQAMVNELTNGSFSGDVALHGLSRRGFGLPALLDLIGEHPGRGLGTRPNVGQNIPFPSTDMSRSLGMGQLSPVDIGKVLDPGKDSQGVLADQMQQGSGAIFGFGFNLYKALNDYKTPATDVKRWEKVMPRAMAGASRAFRAFNEARTRGSGGPAGAATILPFDVRDPEQMAEIIAMGLGFMPTRVNAQWDATQMKMELNQTYQLQREMLLRDAYEAQSGGKKEEIAKTVQAIKDYNNDLPSWAKGYALTGEGVRKSMGMRYNERLHREANSPSKASEFGVSKHIDALFPESVVDAKRINR